jgi:hypothetical protein
MRHLFLAVVFLVGIFAAPTSRAANQPTKEWTFLIYLNGNNSLDSFGSVNINEMEKVGSTDKINVVVQWASIQNGGTKRLFIQKDNDPDHVTSPVLQDMGVVDMGNYQSLIDFVKWGVANYPAQHYMIDVWDHGGGFHLQNNLSNMTLGFDVGAHGGVSAGVSPMDISWDDNSGHFITTKELGLAINQSAQIIGHPVDVYASDACLMAMPEVASEMAGAVSVYAGSEETEPGAGWPYDTFLTAWNAQTSATAIDVGKMLTDAYVASYQNGSNGTSEVTFSAYDMSKLADLNQSVKNLGTALSNLDDKGKAAAITAINATQTYEYHDYGDLIDFTGQLAKAGVSVRADVLAEVSNAVNNFVLVSKATPTYSGSHGVSIWLPADTDTFSSYWSMYKGFAFQKATQWGTALKNVLGAK